MERSVEVLTGESVAFSYELAGLGSRFFAVAIDLSIQVGVVILALVLLALLSLTSIGSGIRTPDFLGKTELAVLGGVYVFLGFLIFFGYFIAFEWRWNGRTPGKRIVGIRVVRDGGFPLDFTGSVVRNTVRVVEFLFGFYLLSAISTLVSARNRRIGDFAAGTIVVRDNRFERVEAPRYATDAAPSDAHALPGDVRALVAGYAARRTSLAARARIAVAADVARVVRPLLAADFSYLDDDDLLVHLAKTELGLVTGTDTSSLSR